MSRPDNSHLVIAAARRRAASTRKRAVTALRRMENAGAPITFDAVAREAQVTPLMALQPGRSSRRGPATPTTTAAFNDDHCDPQPATRVQRLATTTSRGRGHPNQVLEAENKQLRDALALALGEQRAADVLGSHDTPTNKSAVLIGPC